MFNKSNKTEILTEKVDTLIGPNTTFEGTIRAEGTVRINGNVIGEVIVSGNVIVGDSSTVKGNIKAENAYISGIVHGNISTSDQLHMTTSSKVVGDIEVKNVIIDEGAVFNGHCKAILQDTPKTNKNTDTDSEDYNIA